MTFAKPIFLYGLFLIPLVGLFLWWARGRRKSDLARLGSPVLVERLSSAVNWRGRRWRDVLWLVVLAVIAHQVGGGWRQALRTAWPLLVYATCVVLWLRRSARDAFVVTVTVHAFYNAVFFAVGLVGSLAVGDD